MARVEAWRCDHALRAAWRAHARRCAQEKQPSKSSAERPAGKKRKSNVAEADTVWGVGNGSTPIRADVLAATVSRLCTQNAELTTHPRYNGRPGPVAAARSALGDLNSNLLITDPCDSCKALPHIPTKTICSAKHPGLCQHCDGDTYDLVLHVSANLNTLFSGFSREECLGRVLRFSLQFLDGESHRFEVVVLDVRYARPKLQMFARTVPDGVGRFEISIDDLSMVSGSSFEVLSKEFQRLRQDIKQTMVETIYVEELYMAPKQGSCSLLSWQEYPATYFTFRKALLTTPSTQLFPIVIPPSSRARQTKAVEDIAASATDGELGDLDREAALLKTAVERDRAIKRWAKRLDRMNQPPFQAVKRSLSKKKQKNTGGAPAQPDPVDKVGVACSRGGVGMRGFLGSSCQFLLFFSKQEFKTCCGILLFDH